jgi:alkanesulfonate monooxygenase SsuD/methylene tetrahydromethanopterin reductase-like flavin-dependent oxidoreductase (luciferase family)
VLFNTSIVIGETMQDAQDRRERMTAALEANINVRLAGMSYLTMIDFSKFDLDAPLPPVTTNASRASFEAYLSGDGTRTLRQMMLDPGSGGLDFVGTADSIAAEMQAVMQEVGGDGFLIHDPLTRKAITEVTDGLAPALQQRGLLQSDYPCKTFRENLLAF